MKLKNKTALVCGGSDGLGFGTAVELAKMGCRLILTGRSESKLLDKINKIKTTYNADHQILIADFNDTADLATKIDALTASTPIHILINNCGGPPPGRLLDADIADLATAFRLHILASHLISQKVIPSMEKAGYGRIINIVSTSIRQPIVGLGVSNTIRGAMGSWAKTLSSELASSGITVNNLLPGTTKTTRVDNIIAAKQEKHSISKAAATQILLDEIPMGRFAEVEEIAKAIAFLASPDASYITGVNLQVDGGKIKSI